MNIICVSSCTALLRSVWENWPEYMCAQWIFTQLLLMPYESLIICRHDDGISPTSSPCLLLHSFVQVFVTVTSGKTRKTCKLLCDNYNEIQSECVKRKRHDIRFYFAWQTLKGRERSTIFLSSLKPFLLFCKWDWRWHVQQCKRRRDGERMRHLRCWNRWLH